MASVALVDKLEVWGFEEGITLFKNGSLGFGFEVKPLDIACTSDDEINQIRESLKTFLSSLPVGIDVQFLQTIEKTSANDLKPPSVSEKKIDPIVESLTQARVAKFDRLNELGLLPMQANLILFRLSLDHSSRKNVSLLNFSFSDTQEIARSDFEKSLQRAKAILTEMERSLQACGFTIKKLSPEELTQKIYKSWNPHHPLDLKDFYENDIRDRVILSELSKDLRGFRLGDTHHRVLSLKILPEGTFAGMASALTELPFDSRLCLSIHVPDQSKEIEWLKLNRRMAYAMVVGKKGVSDLESSAKLQDIEEVLNEIVKDGERIFLVSLNVILRSQDEKELDEQVGQVLQVIRELSGSEGFLETYAAFDIFSQTSIPNARSKERLKRVKTSNLCDLLPVFGLWRGFEKPAVLLRTRMGSLFKFDPFSAQLTNANQIISGGSVECGHLIGTDGLIV